MLVNLYQSTQHYNPEGDHLHIHHRENSNPTITLGAFSLNKSIVESSAETHGTVYCLLARGIFFGGVVYYSVVLLSYSS
jgi:hypothetical protein